MWNGEEVAIGAKDRETTQAKPCGSGHFPPDDCTVPSYLVLLV